MVMPSEPRTVSALIAARLPIRASNGPVGEADPERAASSRTRSFTRSRTHEA